MNIAIIYTGSVRTMEKTITFFKKNVLIDDNHHVFSVLQSDNIMYDNAIIHNIMQNNLKNIIWFNKENSEWINIRNKLLNNMNITQQWKNYLGFNSGSMIEYYQMYLAYLSMEKYEQEHNIKYDYIFRIRTDCVITRPINFICNNDIKNILENIKLCHHINNMKDAVNIFMTSLIDKNRLYVKAITRVNYNGSSEYDALFSISDEDEFIKAFINYFNHGKYIITFRENVMYFAKRHIFTDIYKLGISYGEHKNYDDGHWFNAECQLKSICLQNSIDIYDSYTTKEVDSLYNYKEENFYDSNGLIVDDSSIFFFLQRH